MTDTHSLRVSRIIKAPREKVYAAWITPEALSKWFAPGPRQPKAEHLDVRIGGAYRIVMQGADDAPVAIGEYQDVVSNEKLVFTWNWEGATSPPTMVTVSFADVDGGTEVMLVHEQFANDETRDHHRMGWDAIMDKLAEQF